MINKKIRVLSVIHFNPFRGGEQTQKKVRPSFGGRTTIK